MSSDSINTFLESKAFAVAGASNNRDKFGNKVLRCYLQHDYAAYPINPNESEVEGITCYKSVKDLPNEVQSLSIITPPAITETIVQAAIAKGISNIWMQPGAESEKAIQLCLENKINVIAGGPCILVELGFNPSL